MPTPVTLISGDGIGPSISSATVRAPRSGGRRHFLGCTVCRHGWRGPLRRSDPRSDARFDQADARRAEGAARDARRRRVPLDQRGAAQDVRAVRERAARAHDAARRPLRERRHRAHSREHRGAVHRDRALHQDRQRSACGGRVHRAHHARGLGADHPLRVRLRREAGPEEGDARPQGEHPQVLAGALPRRRPRWWRASTRGSSSRR